MCYKDNMDTQRVWIRYNNNIDIHREYECVITELFSTRIVRVCEKQKYIILDKILFRLISLEAGIHSSLWMISKLLPRLGNLNYKLGETWIKVEYVSKSWICSK